LRKAFGKLAAVDINIAAAVALTVGKWTKPWLGEKF